MASEARTRARPGSVGRALSNSFRKYAFVPKYRPEQAVWMTTADGVRLAGAQLDGPRGGAFASVVLVHGLTNSCRTPRIHAFAHLLARDVNVLVPDLRGHGRSGGVSTLGRDEPLDVEAAVAAARAAWPGVPVVTIGVSLGGASAALHAGTFGGVAAVVAVSAPSRWGAWETPATKRIHRYATSRAGRWVVSYALHTRISDRCEGVPDSRDVVAAISPSFVLVVHDPEDHYFGGDHAEAVYEWAREPKALWWERDAGHGTDLLTPSLAARLVEELRRRLAEPPGPSL